MSTIFVFTREVLRFNLLFIHSLHYRLERKVWPRQSFNLLFIHSLPKIDTSNNGDNESFNLLFIPFLLLY